MSLYNMAFRLGAEPFFFNQVTKKNAKQTYAKILTWFTILGAFFMLFVVVFIDLFAQILLGKPEYKTHLSKLFYPNSYRLRHDCEISISLPPSRALCYCCRDADESWGLAQCTQIPSSGPRYLPPQEGMVIAFCHPREFGMEGGAQVVTAPFRRE